MRIFGSDRISGLMQRLGMEEGVPIEHGMVTRAIERAQKQVEAQNFSVRKHLLEYDDVMNKQRENIYALRRADPRRQDSAQDEDDEEVVDTRDYLMALAEDILDAHRRDATRRARRTSRSGISTRSSARSTRVFGSTPADARLRATATSDEIRDALWERIAGSRTRRRKSWSAARCCSASSATSCCRSSTRSGRTTSTASTT